jgi:hypothetical protein
MSNSRPGNDHIPVTDCGPVKRSMVFNFRNSIRQRPEGSKMSATSRRNARHTSDETTMHQTFSQ